MSVLAVAGCIKSPQAPSWETELNLPLLNKIYYAWELEDSTDFIIENDSLFFLQHGNVNSADLGEQMGINARPNNFVWLPLPPETTFAGALGIDETGVGSDDLAVSYALIEEWTLEFAFQNVDPALQTVSVTFDDIYTPAGQPLSVNISSFDVTTQVSLDAYSGEYYSIGLPGNTTLYDSLSFTVQTQSDAGAPSPVAEMKILFQNSISLNLMEGMAFHKILPIEDHTIELSLDYPVGADSAIIISEDGARMDVEICNHLGFPVELRGRFTAYNDDGESRTIFFDETDHMVFDAATTMYEPVNSMQTMRDSVGWLLNILPSRIELTDAWFIVGLDTQETGFAYSGSDARGTLTGRLPFLFRLTGHPMRLPEPEVSDISSTNREQIEKYARGGHVIFLVENMYPAASEVDIYLSTSADEDSLYDHPMLHFPRDGEANYVPAMDSDSLKYELTQEDILFFTNPTIYLGMKFTFDQTQGDIYIAPQDYMGLIGRTRIILFIDNE
ncbi:MAG: hypothetical protein K8R90_01715 [Candidatus Cloacimonetes bacterium]|nr:hypothetical protein [Candidatus Cloacimonadota bacterium]